MGFLAVIPQLDIEKLKKDSSNPNIDKLIDIDKSDATNLGGRNPGALSRKRPLAEPGGRDGGLSLFA